MTYTPCLGMVCLSCVRRLSCLRSRPATLTHTPLHLLLGPGGGGGVSVSSTHAGFKFQYASPRDNKLQYSGAGRDSQLFLTG